MYKERFNLVHEDLAVMGRGAAPRSAQYTFATSWSNYVRATFKPKTFHGLHGPGREVDRVYLYVLDHKSLAGRDAIPEDGAKARPLEVCVSSPSAMMHLLARSRCAGSTRPRRAW